MVAGELSTKFSVPAPRWPRRLEAKLRHGAGMKQVEIHDWTPRGWRISGLQGRRPARALWAARALRIDRDIGLDVGCRPRRPSRSPPTSRYRSPEFRTRRRRDLVAAMARAGYVWRSDNPELTKRYFRERRWEARCHVHVRLAGSWNEQWALLFRDFLRAHAAVAADYEALKRRLAVQHRDDRRTYTDAKGDFVWATIRLANDWAALTGWRAHSRTLESTRAGRRPRRRTCARSKLEATPSTSARAISKRSNGSRCANGRPAKRHESHAGEGQRRDRKPFLLSSSPPGWLRETRNLWQLACG